jgi:hypothetical protein
MVGFNRIETYKRLIANGKIDFTMAMVDFQLAKGNITQIEYDELNELAYPTPVEVIEPVEEE